jgi:LTXXQ motif family protein
MSRPIYWPKRLAAAVGFVAAWSIAGDCQSVAAGMQRSQSSQILLAQAQPARPQNVEANIAELHRKLQITAAQEAQFNAVAAVMRDNARLEASVPQQPANSTAVDDLRAYIKYTELELGGLKKMLPPLEALYATLSPAQKKAGDALFRQGPGG